MSTILKRIKSISDLEGLSITALENAIGASKGVLSRALLNGTDIQSKWIQLIFEKFPHYSANWLLTGQKPMLGYQHISSPPLAPEGEKVERLDQERVEAQKHAIAAHLETINSLKETISSQKETIEAFKSTIQLLEKSQKTKEAAKKTTKPTPPSLPSLF